MIQYKNIRNKGSIVIKNILSRAELGANAFISRPSISQSNDTNDVEKDPIILIGVKKVCIALG